MQAKHGLLAALLPPLPCCSSGAQCGTSAAAAVAKLRSAELWSAAAGATTVQVCSAENAASRWKQTPLSALPRLTALRATPVTHWHSSQISLQHGCQVKEVEHSPPLRCLGKGKVQLWTRTCRPVPAAPAGGPATFPPPRAPPCVTIAVCCPTPRWPHGSAEAGRAPARSG